MIALLVTLALNAQGCTSPRPADIPNVIVWVCVNGSWQTAPWPQSPQPPDSPQIPRPTPTGSINKIDIIGIYGVVEDPKWKPGAIRTLQFRLIVPEDRLENNCDGALKADWFAPLDLHIVQWDGWLGAQHVGPAADIRTTAVVSYPGTTVYEQPTYRWSLERYDTRTNYNHPDRSSAPAGTFWFIEKGGRLTVEFFCSAIPERKGLPKPPIGYLANFLVSFTVPPAQR